MANGPRIVALGAIARRALRASAGAARPLAGFALSPWYEANQEILWIGARLPALHPRAVLTETSPERGQVLRFRALPRSAWAPRPASPPPERLRAALARLRTALVATGTPGGFGMLLAGNAPAFPLDFAMPRVRALVRASAGNDPAALQDAAVRLVGLGTGLTPSGDDLLGGLMFARRWIRPADERCAALARRLAAEVRERSHAVSAALFADLAAGKSFAPLHEVCEGLAARDGDRALSAARTLACIGHSSGWDMLAGFFLGANALPGRAFSRG